MIGPPDRTEAAEYYFTYIDKAQTNDILGHLDAQTGQFLAFLSTVTEERSLYRYEPGKWSFRQALNHVNDTERVFAFRACWIGRGGEAPLPSFDQDLFAANSNGDARSWADHIEEFRAIRAATMILLRSLPAHAWSRVGTASDNQVTTRALAYMIAGHVEHHRQVLVERYF
ncbi:MAG: DinB family protein [Bryobacteraceae bacterium]